MIFSPIIVYKISTKQRRRSKVYHRLICGISIADTSSSFWLGMSTWPMPRETGILWAIGTTTTCQVQGFFTQTRIASTFYNASLSLYFLLTIKYGWKEAQLRRIEPWLHGIPLMWAIASASLRLGLGAFGDADLWCGVTNDVYRWVAFYGPLWVMILMISINCLLILQHVRRIEVVTDRRNQSTMLEFNVPQPPVPMEQNPGGDEDETRQHGNRNMSTDCSEDTLSAPSDPEYQANDQNKCLSEDGSGSADDVGTCPKQGKIAGVDADDVAAGAHTTPDDCGECPVQRSDTTRWDSVCYSHATLSPSSPISRSNSRRKISFLRRRSSDRLAPDKLRLKRTRRVARQTFWYAGAFYFNWTALSYVTLYES